MRSEVEGRMRVFSSFCKVAMRPLTLALSREGRGNLHTVCSRSLS
jgi:hypothetical protein